MTRTTLPAGLSILAGALALAQATPPADKAPLKPPDLLEQAKVIAEMREYALNYTAKLPNFLCVQVTRRFYSDRDGRVPSNGAEVIQEQVNFYQHRESYKVQLRNGLAVQNMTHEQLGGATSSGEWGSMLNNIFAIQNGAQFDWSRWGALRGRTMYVFAYRIEKNHGYSMRDIKARTERTSAYAGLIYADAETREIQRITMKLVEIPPDFTVTHLQLRLDYKPTHIAGRIYTLPFNYELTSDDIDGRRQNVAEFKLYQVYGADTTLMFETGPTAKKQP